METKNATAPNATPDIAAKPVAMADALAEYSAAKIGLADAQKRFDDAKSKMLVNDAVVALMRELGVSSAPAAAGEKAPRKPRGENISAEQKEVMAERILHAFKGETHTLTTSAVKGFLKIDGDHEDRIFAVAKALLIKDGALKPGTNKGKGADVVITKAGIGRRDAKSTPKSDKKAS